LLSLSAEKTIEPCSPFLQRKQKALALLFCKENNRLLQSLSAETITLLFCRENNTTLAFPICSENKRLLLSKVAEETGDT
jgi:hypothetical protein